MFDNLLLIAIVIIIMWVAVLAYYLFASNRQIDLQENIEALNKMLEQSEIQDDRR